VGTGMSVDRTNTVLIVGAGIVGLAAAIALRRALPDAAITLLGVPGDTDGWIDRLGACSPVIHRFHRQIGLDPRLFARRTGAEPVHLRRYRWADGREAREASTPVIQFVEGVPLHHIWLRGRDTTGGDFAALLLAIRQARSDDGGFGARYDLAAYRALLGEMAGALGIVRCDASEVRVTTDGPRIEGVGTEDEVLTADLYVDAAGPRSRLLSALGIGWHDWFLPPMALTVMPGGDGTLGEEAVDFDGNAVTWRTRRWSARLTPSTGPAAPGCLARFWSGNAVAIGEAAASAPVIDGVGFGLALDDILRLVGLLPRPDGTGREADEYDRRTGIAYASLCDWTAFSLGQRDTPMLAETLDAFEARGRVSRPELDPVQPGEWLARLMALGPAPRRIDPTALALSEDIVRRTMARATPQPGPTR